jgi:L-iditol 2-dehydrogenase
VKALNWASDRTLEIAHVPTPEFGVRDVLISVEATGICGSDLHAYLGKHRFRKAPAILGHEVVGRVVQLGEQVESLNVGDLVTVMPLIACGTCSRCETGRSHLCSNKVMPGTPGWAGTFAEYFVAPESVTLKLPGDFPIALGALLEPLAVAVHAARQADSIAGKAVRILGAGPIGHLIAVVARNMAAGRIDCIDPEPAALDAARKQGFRAYEPSDAGDLRAADVTFVTANHSSSLDEALGYTDASGAIVVVAMYEGKVPVDIYELVFSELTMRGSMLYSLDDFREAVEVARENASGLSEIVTPLMPLNEAPAEFERLARGERSALKSLLSPGAA